MTEEQEESANEQPVDEGSQPTLSAAERVFVRLSFWQTVLAVAGVFIAIVALYAALGESAAVRQQTAAAVWPFVQMTLEDYDTEAGAGFTMSFTNAGVGPAKMDSMRMIIRGEPVSDWQHAVKLLGGNVDALVARNFVSRRVIRPDETIDLISTMDADLARRFQAAVADPESSITYCYCSIFDQCWLTDSRKDLQKPDTVSECPDFGKSAYRN